MKLTEANTKLAKILKSFNTPTICPPIEFKKQAAAAGVDKKDYMRVFKVAGAKVGIKTYDVAVMLAAVENDLGSGKRGRKAAAPVVKKTKSKKAPAKKTEVVTTNDPVIEGTFYATDADIADELSLMGTTL
jgi:hypothetical protein